jgi:O-antigen biosynthesis protein
MIAPIKVIDLELSEPWPPLQDLGGYLQIQALVRLEGVPLGYLTLPITNGGCDGQTMAHAVATAYGPAIARAQLATALLAGLATTSDKPWVIGDPSPPRAAQSHPIRWPKVTVAVCTRDRPQDLALCLDSLLKLDYADLEILVIDNAPSSDATAALVQRYQAQLAPNDSAQNNSAQNDSAQNDSAQNDSAQNDSAQNDSAQNAQNWSLHYVQEPRPGLDWARNRAILEATGEIIAYTDDDGIADRHWLTALAQVFADSPDVMAVTGLVVPWELETEAQVLFERQGGFGKGMTRRWYQAAGPGRLPWWLCIAGSYGTGANMAYRRSVFPSIGRFDPALDVGTPTQGAGDLDLFYRVLRAGHTLVYEPAAIIRHRHRRTYAELRRQISANGGVLASWTAAVRRHPGDIFPLMILGAVWLLGWHVRRLATSLMVPPQVPRDLMWAELGGCWRGLWTYSQSRRQQRRVVAQLGEQPEMLPEILPEMLPIGPSSSQSVSASTGPSMGPSIARSIHSSNDSPNDSPNNSPNDSPNDLAAVPSGAIATRQLDLAAPLTPLTDVTAYATTRIFAAWQGRVIGQCDIPNHHGPIGRLRLLDALVPTLSDRLIENPTPIPAPPLPQLPASVTVSIVIPTCNRPDTLRTCLTALLAQPSPRSVEIVVVDNRPDSGLAAPVLAEFPMVKAIQEARSGANYARNAGILASSGTVIVLIDDDVMPAPDWLEALVAPFAAAHVMGVTGNILPRRLNTESERLFEQYGNGGLGRGFERREVSRAFFEQSWFYAVPTWELGGTANSAFRASIFQPDRVGLLDPALGPGMPSAAGEDIDLFYRILRQGGTMVYEPAALVWHQHRQTMPALRQQLRYYSRGIIAYHLTTWRDAGDGRGLVAALFGLPAWQLKRLRLRLVGKCAHPIGMILAELLAHLGGGWFWWQSRRRVRQLARQFPPKPPQF